MLLASGGVIVAELINTALEKRIDHLHPQEHAVIKTVKDTLATAVLVMAITAFLVDTVFIYQRYLIDGTHIG